jgi:hypothetical protein
MLSTALKNQRGFASVNKNIAILANSKQADLIGSKILTSLQEVSGESDFNVYGYGG